MKLAPSKFHVDELVNGWNAHVRIEKDGKKEYVPCRPVGYFGIRHRIRMGWAVFTGKADALFWEQQ